MYLPDIEERRFALRLLDYWQLVRGDREFPMPDDMKPDDMGKDAASLALVVLGNRAELAEFRFVGAHLRLPGWGDDHGLMVGEVPKGTLLHELFRNLSQVMDRPVPLSLGGVFEFAGRRAIGRSLLLPLSTDGIRATHVFGGINYRFLDSDGSGPRENLS